MLERAGDAGTRDVTLGAAADVAAEKADRAVVQRQRAGDEIEHRSLSGAVGAGQAEDLADLHLEADIVDRDQAAEATGRARDGEDGLARLRLGAAVEGCCGGGRGRLRGGGGT